MNLVEQCKEAVDSNKHQVTLTIHGDQTPSGRKKLDDSWDSPVGQIIGTTEQNRLLVVFNPREVLGYYKKHLLARVDVRYT